MIGRKFWFTGKVGVYDRVRNKICIENVHTTNGFSRDHMWVKYSKRLDFKRGTKISFTALLTQYAGMNGEDQITKIGLMTVRHVKEMK